MLLTHQHIHTIQLLLEEQEGITEPLIVNRTVSGGSINTCYQLKAGSLYFLKINDALKFPEMFTAEAEGLKLIRQTNRIHVPHVIACGTSGNEQFLLMHWIDSGRNSASVQAKLGRQLSAMHQHTAGEFGLDHNNYMGSLTQRNTFHSDWTDFFIEERLEPQLKIAVQSGFINDSLRNDFQLLFSRFGNLYPREKPALVHGDLWSGNYMINASGEPVLIDPAFNW